MQNQRRDLNRSYLTHKVLILLVGVTGFEPATPTSRTGQLVDCAPGGRASLRLQALAGAARDVSWCFAAMLRSVCPSGASERAPPIAQRGLLTLSWTHERERVARRESVARGCAPWLSRTPLQT